MPAFVRDGATWKESIPFARNGSAWTDEDDQLYVRDGGEWKLIYPDPADAGDLLPVEGLAVTSGPNHFSVTIGWTNPTQPTITPTAVQVRIAELGAVWTELDYPVTAYAWSALDASTEYFAQVRLIRRVDGIVTDVSPVKSVQFTTTAAPIGAPAEDPGSPGGTSTTFPLGGSTGNPTAPSTPDGCWWEWKLQILDQDTTTIDWQDTGITGTEDGDAEDITYDTTSLDNTRTYRTCVREACDTNSDGTADTWGDWNCGPPFAGNFDWGVTCGNIPQSPVVGYDAAADAVWAFPRYCAVGDGLDTTGLVDAVSNTQIGKGADYAAVYTTTDGEWGVVADADGGITMTAGLAAIADAIGAGLDFTLAIRRRLSPGHTFSNGRTTTIASIGGGALVVKAIETATGWYPTVSFRLTSGYVTLSGSSSELSTVGDIATVGLTWDADGDKLLYVNAVEVDSDTSGDDLHANVTVQPMYWTAEVGLGSTMQQLGWDRILTADELAEFSVKYPPTSGLVVLSSIAQNDVTGVIADNTRELLYVMDAGDNVIRVYDISDARNPSLLGTSATTGIADPRMGFLYGSTHLIIADRINDRLLSFDVTNPASPTLVASSATSNLDRATDVADVGGGHLVTGTGGDQRRVKLTTNGTSFTTGSSLFEGGTADRTVLAVGGGYALYATGSGVTVLVASSTWPSTVGSITLGWASALAVYAFGVNPEGTVAYVAGNNGFSTLDLTNLPSLTELDTIDSASFGLGSRIYAPGNGYAYCFGQIEKRLVVVDVRDPSDISIAADIDAATGGWTATAQQVLAGHDDVLYLGDGPNLRVIGEP